MTMRTQTTKSAGRSKHKAKRAPDETGKEVEAGSLQKPTAIRLMPEMVTAIDKALLRIRAERLGQRVERADAIRILVAEALHARGITIDATPNTADANHAP